MTTPACAEKLSGADYFFAAFLAAQDNSPVQMAHTLKAIRTELLKSDRLIDESQFR